MGCPDCARRSSACVPSGGEPYLALAEALRATGAAAPAAAAYGEALRRAPGSRAALHNVGVALAQSGQLADAAANLERAMALGIRDAAIASDLALVYRQLGRTDDAIAALRKGLELD